MAKYRKTSPRRRPLPRYGEFRSPEDEHWSRDAGDEEDDDLEEFRIPYAGRWDREDLDESRHGHRTWRKRGR